MALIANNGNYLRIINVMPFEGIITIERWQSKEHRQSGATEFWKPVIETYQIPFILDEISVDETLNLRNNLLKECYKAIKKDANYSEMEDDI
jgi:hypothetical protein